MMWSDGGGVGLHFFRSQSGKSRCLVQATGLTFTTRYRLYAFGMFTCLCNFKHVMCVFNLRGFVLTHVILNPGARVGEGLNSGY